MLNGWFCSRKQLTKQHLFWFFVEKSSDSIRFSVNLIAVKHTILLRQEPLNNWTTNRQQKFYWEWRLDVLYARARAQLTPSLSKKGSKQSWDWVAILKLSVSREMGRLYPVSVPMHRCLSYFDLLGILHYWVKKFLIGYTDFILVSLLLFSKIAGSMKWNRD